MKERFLRVRSLDYLKKAKDKLGKWIVFADVFNKWFTRNKHVIDEYWSTDTPGYNNMNKLMWFSNKEWNQVINDKSRRKKTDIGKLLINKSLMVYVYSIYVALTSPHGENKQIIREQFHGTVNAFIHDEKQMATRDMIDYYTKAKKGLGDTGYEELHIDEGLITISDFSKKKNKGVEIKTGAHAQSNKPVVAKMKHLSERHHDMTPSVGFITLGIELSTLFIYRWLK